MTDGKKIKSLIQKNTYGGDKMGIGHKKPHRPKKEMPAMACQSGIKMEWEHGCDIYPSRITIQMTDGKWIEYQVHIRQLTGAFPDIPETTPWHREYVYGGFTCRSKREGKS